MLLNTLFFYAMFLAHKSNFRRNCLQTTDCVILADKNINKHRNSIIQNPSNTLKML
ncbi:hypothetical protein KsCSTR_17460 [Candidatus Kuenenia stuttgartiensis]|uniref:Uncharacterized protein n=1 Tax=Kuenenia stuttgartiensis TaxID=174633 RepID=Q1Q249_KUEST|nr:hypothetical protein KsCSTR_17460 [Candidatus Kuenenia stuttgartiensis]CAJ74095.1 unknown protein [Candidatus Kuenenia stuttgartiensis]